MNIVTELLKFLKLNISETAAGWTAFILETVCPDILDHFLKAFCEFFEILLVEEYLVR